MKKGLSLLLCLVLVVMSIVMFLPTIGATAATSEFYGGDGTEENPYQISTTRHLDVAQTVVDTLGHTYSSKVTTEPTNKTTGIRTYTCIACGDSYTEIIPTITCEHNYKSVVTSPTCTTQGYTTYTCSNCGDVYIDSYIEKLEHTWGDGVATTAPTCTADGERTFTCSCGATKTDIELATGHNYSTEWTVDKEATCAEAGSKSHHCTRCDAKADVTEIPVIEHSWNDGEVTKEPTNEETGKKLFTRTACGHTRTEEIPKLTFVTGNFDDNEEITSADAVHLLMYTFFPEDYPLTNAQPASLIPTNMSVK